VHETSYSFPSGHSVGRTRRCLCSHLLTRQRPKTLTSTRQIFVCAGTSSLTTR
jgi:membrane-associated phospholipid phosphatase